METEFLLRHEGGAARTDNQGSCDANPSDQTPPGGATAANGQHLTGQEGEESGESSSSLGFSPPPSPCETGPRFMPRPGYHPQAGILTPPPAWELVGRHFQNTRSSSSHNTDYSPCINPKHMHDVAKQTREHIMSRLRSKMQRVNKHEKPKRLVKNSAPVNMSAFKRRASRFGRFKKCRKGTSPTCGCDLCFAEGYQGRPGPWNWFPDQDIDDDLELCRRKLARASTSESDSNSEKDSEKYEHISESDSDNANVFHSSEVSGSEDFSVQWPSDMSIDHARFSLPPPSPPHVVPPHDKQSHENFKRQRREYLNRFRQSRTKVKDVKICLDSCGESNSDDSHSDNEPYMFLSSKVSGSEDFKHSAQLPSDLISIDHTHISLPHPPPVSSPDKQHFNDSIRKRREQHFNDCLREKREFLDRLRRQSRSVRFSPFQCPPVPDRQPFGMLPPPPGPFGVPPRPSLVHMNGPEPYCLPPPLGFRPCPPPVVPPSRPPFWEALLHEGSPASAPLSAQDQRTVTMVTEEAIKASTAEVTQNDNTEECSHDSVTPDVSDEEDSHHSPSDEDSGQPSPLENWELWHRGMDEITGSSSI